MSNNVISYSDKRVFFNPSQDYYFYDEVPEKIGDIRAFFEYLPKFFPGNNPMESLNGFLNSLNMGIGKAGTNYNLLKEKGFSGNVLSSIRTEFRSLVNTRGLVERIKSKVDQSQSFFYC